MCTLNECALVDNVTVSSGGGAGYSTLNHCTLTGNVAADGGATYDGTLNNCLLANNSADYWAGGACRGTLNDCMLTNNWAIYGGGAGEATLNFCTVAGNWADEGGGAEAAYLNNCMVFSNTAGLDGGGVAGCMVSDSTLVGNRAQTGGGAASSTLNNCTIVGNSTLSGGGVAIGCALANSIVYYNWSDPEAPGSTDSSFDHCCLPEDPGGTGNITNEPAFVDLAGGNLRLQAGSPCINAGTNAYVTSRTDLDGRPRIVGASVDMGAYEFQGEFTNWLAQFSLPTDGTADFTDPDGDRFNNWQEYCCLTDPTNALSFLRLLPPAPAGADVTLTWPSAPARNYALEWSTNLFASSFTPLATNLPGQPGTTTFTHTNGAGLGPCFYRVAVP